MRYHRIAERLFNRPLLISEEKLNVLQSIFGRKSGLDLAGLPTLEAAEISEKERRNAGYTAQNGLGIIGIYGPLMHRRLDSEFPSGGPTTYSEIRRAFDLALVDDAVQGIVLDIDSPGGEANGVFDLADHIFASRDLKPITAVINESAFSAAYLLASAAGRIVLPRTGGVGSIGVIATHADFSRAEDAAGVTITHVFAGARKADFSPHQPLSADAFATLQAMVDETYGIFVDSVARNRGMATKDVRATEAAVYEGKKAVAAKLADQVSPVDQALGNARRGRGTRRVSASTHAKEEQTMTLEELRQNHPDLVTQIEASARQGLVPQANVDTARAEGAQAERARVLELLEAGAPLELTVKGVKEGMEAGPFYKAALQAEREGRAQSLEDLKTGLPAAVPGLGKQAAVVSEPAPDAEKAAEFEAKVEAWVKEKGGARSDAMSQVIAKAPELHQAWLRQQNKR